MAIYEKDQFHRINSAVNRRRSRHEAEKKRLNREETGAPKTELKAEQVNGGFEGRTEPADLFEELMRKEEDAGA